MHLKPINRQGKKRRKLKNIPALSCGKHGFAYPTAEKGGLPMADAQVNTKKDKAAA